MKNKINISFLYQIFFLLGEQKNQIPLIIFYFLLLSSFDIIGLSLIAPYVSLIINPELFTGSYIYSLLKIDEYNLEINIMLQTISLLY